MTGYVVERYWPGVTQADVAAICATLLDLDRDDVRFLGAILMPGDEVALFRFEADTTARILQEAERVGLRCDRVVPAHFYDPIPD